MASSPKKYDAFISYYRDQDGPLADALQKSLRKLGARKYLLQFRALEIFRDEINNDGHGGARQRITNSLEQAEFLILLASHQGKQLRKEEAKFDWLDFEVSLWLKTRMTSNFSSDVSVPFSSLKIIVCLTDGRIECLKNSDEFDWAVVDCLPECLRTYPLSGVAWVDFRDIKNRSTALKDVLTLDQPDFKQKVAEISSVIQHTSVDKLISKDITYKRIGRVSIAIAAILLVTLTALSILFAVRAEENRQDAIVQKTIADSNRLEALRQKDSADLKTQEAIRLQLYAELQRNRAIHSDSVAQLQRDIALNERNKAMHSDSMAKKQRDIAIAQSFANASYALSDKDPTIAISFAERALSINSENTTAGIALLKAYNTGSWFYSNRWDNIYDADISNDGSRVILCDTGSNLTLVDLANKTEKSLAVKSENAKYLASGNILIWKPWSGKGTLGELSLLDPSGNPKVRYEHEFFSPTVSSNAVLLPTFEKDSMVLFRIDPSSGVEQKIRLPTEFHDLSVICRENNGFILISQHIPNATYVILSGKTKQIKIPDNYYVEDIDLYGTKAVLYLAGTRRGVKDAVEIVNLNDVSKTEIISLKEVKEFDHSGTVKFLDDIHIIAASTDGTAQLITLDSKDSRSIFSNRATDVLANSPKHDYFIMARRSGEVSIYNYSGVCIGRLLGMDASDGLNPGFTDIKIVLNGKSVLTVSHNSARLWHKPEYSLKAMRSEEIDFDSIRAKSIAYYQNFKGSEPSARLAFVDNHLSSYMPINNVGQIGLRFQYHDQVDIFQTELSKGVDNIYRSGDLSDFGYCLFSQESARIYILSVTIVENIILNEQKKGRMWRPSPETEDKWLK